MECIVTVLAMEILKNLALWLSSNSIIAIVSVYRYQCFLKSNKQMVWDEVLAFRLLSPPPHILLLFLTQGIGPLQSFHFSVTWWNDHPLRRITTSLSHYPGGLSPPRKDNHLSLTTLGDYDPLERIITPQSLPWRIVTPSSLQPLPWWVTNPDTKWPVVPFRVPYSLPLFPTIILVQLFASIVRVMG